MQDASVVFVDYGGVVRLSPRVCGLGQDSRVGVLVVADPGRRAEWELVGLGKAGLQHPSRTNRPGSVVSSRVNARVRRG